MKVLCVGDSMGMPRKGVLYEDTWYYRIQERYPQIRFIDKFRRNLTSKDIYKNDDYSANYVPDIVVLQCGICDCAPRIINEKNVFWRGMIFLCDQMRIKNQFWHVVKFLFKRNKRTRVWVPLSDFKNYVSDYVNNLINNCNIQRVIIIGICTPSVELQSKSQYLMSNINKYNSVYKELSYNNSKHIVYINPLCNADESLYVDGYHANKLGHNHVLEALDKELKSIIDHYSCSE